VIAAGGLALVLFLVLHLAGISQALLDPAGFERYAAALHRQGWLPLAEIVLIGVFLAHPVLALQRAMANRRARGPVAGPLRSRRRGGGEGVAALAAAAVPWSGSVLLLFLAVHLAQLRWHRPAAGEELARLLTALASPWSLTLYVLAGVAVALHLFHGHESAHRSLGLLDPTNGGRIRAVGRVLALLLGLGFALTPIALVLGWSADVLIPLH
jgi:succinate dehydrogenase / fumarate reductase cytochrome b subunit